MIELFFSLITDLCVIILLKEGFPFAKFEKYDKNFHSENFVKNLNNLLSKNKFSLSDVKKIYFISGLTEQTGNRVSISFITAMKILNRDIEVFSIDCLMFQKGISKNCVSVISLGNKTKKYLAEYYNEGKLMFRKKFLKLTDINEINFNNVEIFSNFEIEKSKLKRNINFADNFLLLKDSYFEKFEF